MRLPFFSVPCRRRPDAKDGICRAASLPTDNRGQRHARARLRSRSWNKSDRSGSSGRKMGLARTGKRATATVANASLPCPPLRQQQLRQLGAQQRFQADRSGWLALCVHRLGKADNAVNCRQRRLAEQLARDALDRVACHGTRRQTLGGDNAQPGVRKVVATRVENEVRCPIYRPQTKNG